MTYTKKEIKIKAEVYAKFLNGEAVINCTTRKEAIALFAFLNEAGFKWADDNELTGCTVDYCENGKDTCYHNYMSNKLQYCDCQYYENEGLEIVKFSDAIEE